MNVLAVGDSKPGDVTPPDVAIGVMEPLQSIQPQSRNKSLSIYVSSIGGPHTVQSATCCLIYVINYVVVRHIEPTASVP